MPLRLERVKVSNVGMGIVEQRFNEGLNLITQDVVSRPDIKKARTITLTIEIAPRYDKETQVNMPSITSKVSWKTPGFNDIEVIGMVENGELVVNVDDGENPLQTSLLSFEEAKKGSK